MRFLPDTIRPLESSRQSKGVSRISPINTHLYYFDTKANLPARTSASPYVREPISHRPAKYNYIEEKYTRVVVAGVGIYWGRCWYVSPMGSLRSVKRSANFRRVTGRAAAPSFPTHHRRLRHGHATDGVSQLNRNRHRRSRKSEHPSSSAQTRPIDAQRAASGGISES